MTRGEPVHPPCVVSRGTPLSASAARVLLLGSGELDAETARGAAGEIRAHA